eukprot:jgi/Botrbrau1/17282/Bobra.0015s0039.1
MVLKSKMQTFQLVYPTHFLCPGSWMGRELFSTDVRLVCELGIKRTPIEVWVSPFLRCLNGWGPRQQRRLYHVFKHQRRHLSGPLTSFLHAVQKGKSGLGGKSSGTDRRMSPGQREWVSKPWYKDFCTTRLSIGSCRAKSRLPCVSAGHETIVNFESGSMVTLQSGSRGTSVCLRNSGPHCHGVL